jgi:hypothetical protein
MTDTTIQLSEDEFDERCPLVPNHLNRDAGWVCGDGPGCLFETHGAELEFVRRQDPRTVWTFVDGDDGDQYVLSGYHLVNRIGYLISAVPVPEGTQVEVRIPMEADDETEPREQDNHLPLDVLSAIARDHLGIPTLETRRSDALDFHDVSVWDVRDALRVAFEAGAEAAGARAAPLRAACQIVIDRWECGDLAEAARACGAVIASSPSLSRPGDAGLAVRFDDYEIHGVREFDDGNGTYCEQVPDDQAESWCLFGHVPGQGLDGIGDFETREHAEEVFARITGRRYTSVSKRTKMG